MATWTTIPDTDLDPDSPWTSVKALAVRDNPIAIAEGAAGAPSVQAAGLATGTAERDWVLARTAAATAGAIGTYVLAKGPTSTVAFGATSAGSGLSPAGAYSEILSTGGTEWKTSGVLSGTWRCMGYAPYDNDSPGSGGNAAHVTLWMRVS